VRRPRDPQIDAAVLRATVAALGESGYARLTLDVARLTGTTTPAIYRRWEGRQRLVLAALGSRLGLRWDRPLGRCGSRSVVSPVR
jgi:AcrR family transcriptional regulator